MFVIVQLDRVTHHRIRTLPVVYSSTEDVGRHLAILNQRASTMDVPKFVYQAFQFSEHPHQETTHEG